MTFAWRKHKAVASSPPKSRFLRAFFSLDSKPSRGLLRDRTANESPRQIVDDPTFTISVAPRGWRVHVTWSDGGEGPAIVFASRGEAEIWIARDARDWLVRLAAITPADERG
jgi:hypothetical protein